MPARRCAGGGVRVLAGVLLWLATGQAVAQGGVPVLDLSGFMQAAEAHDPTVAAAGGGPPPPPPPP
ncbi:hypothetical protein LBW87_20655, partial [Herbaspirillum seropedicae]|nr:hypothetical protein [Herbaspirillum sp. alder98]